MQAKEVITILKSCANPTPENLRDWARYGINTRHALDSFRRPAGTDFREGLGPD